MTLASFIKVTGAVFFGQERPELARIREVPFSMQLPMFIMSGLCLAGGVLYPHVISYLLTPAVRSVLNPILYVDSVMGRGYAASHGVSAYMVEAPVLGFWNPVMWLLLFIIVTCAFALVVLSGVRTRGPVSAGEGQEKYANFFSGEKSDHSHVGGSDLFWGFKKDWKGYFRIMDSLHSGRLGDYALWTLAATALLILFVFVFMS